MITLTVTDWRDGAACRDSEPNLFFPIGSTGPAVDQIESAKAICLECSVREECLDHLIILNERHLRRVLNEYVAYFNERRPHQGLGQDSPLGLEPVSIAGPIRCRHVLGGIIRDYYRAAA